MRASARVSTVNSLASMVSMTRRLAASSIAAKSARSPVKSRQVRSSGVEAAAVDQHARDDVEPFVAGGAGDAGQVAASARRRPRIFSTTM